jgi:competence protein ComEA
MKNSTLSLLVLIACFCLDSPARAERMRRVLDGVVNINTATAEELQLLPGIGPAKVERIFAYRRTRPFRTIVELARVKGIGPKTVRRLREHLSVSGPTTAQYVSHTARAAGGSSDTSHLPGLPPPKVAASRQPLTTSSKVDAGAGADASNLPLPEGSAETRRR